MRRSKTKLGTKGTSAADKPNGGSLSEGRRVLRIEARAVQALIERLDDQFGKAIDLLFRCKGKVVVSGMGKSGLVGQKIAATMASTGTPAFFLHAQQIYLISMFRDIDFAFSFLAIERRRIPSL